MIKKILFCFLGICVFFYFSIFRNEAFLSASTNPEGVSCPTISIPLFSSQPDKVIRVACGTCTLRKINHTTDPEQPKYTYYTVPAIGEIKICKYSPTPGRTCTEIELKGYPNCPSYPPDTDTDTDTDTDVIPI